MRPVDKKDMAPQGDYDATFPEIPGGRGVVIFQAKAEIAVSDSVYKSFRNGKMWQSKKVPPEGPGHGPAGVVNEDSLPTLTVLTADRDGKGAAMTVQPYVQRFRKKPGGLQIVRVVLDRDDAVELVRVASEDEWNKNKNKKFPKMQNAEVVIAALRDAIGLGKKSPAFAAKYGAAKPELLKSMGGFCSYCETKYQSGGDLDVEHRLPKSHYPTETLRWGNFLLGCTICNSHVKGTRPSRPWGIETAIKEFSSAGTKVQYTAGDMKAPQSVRYHDIRRAADTYHVWPDAPEQELSDAVMSLRTIKYELCEVGLNGTLIQLPLASMITKDSWSNRFTDRHQWMWANITKNNISTSTRVVVRAVPRQLPAPANATTAVKRACDRVNKGAKNMINLVGLAMRTDESRDQRMMARTDAWFDALRLCDLLNRLGASPVLSRRKAKVAGSKTNMVSADDIWDLAVAAAGKGYYSVWITVFKLAGGEAMAQKLVTRLQNKSDSDPESHAHYHGTDVKTSVIPFLKDL